MTTWMGLEPTTSAVTGRRSNQLNYQAIPLNRALGLFHQATMLLYCIGEKKSRGNSKKVKIRCIALLKCEF